MASNTLTPAEREALLSAARTVQGLLVAFGAEPHHVETLASAVAKLAQVAHDCTSCGMSITNCDKRISAGRRACCNGCSISDTHGDTPSGYAERQRAARAAQDRG